LRKTTKAAPQKRNPKPSRHDAGRLFEFGGRQLVLKGTSGPAKAPSRSAEGKPIRHDIVVGGRTIHATGTSGASQVETRVAIGRPVQHRQSGPDQALTPTGSGKIVGGPTRRA
jgi:hypothetical protein